MRYWVALGLDPMICQIPAWSKSSYCSVSQLSLSPHQTQDLAFRSCLREEILLIASSHLSKPAAPVATCLFRQRPTVEDIASTCDQDTPTWNTPTYKNNDQALGVFMLRGHLVLKTCQEPKRFSSEVRRSLKS